MTRGREATIPVDTESDLKGMRTSAGNGAPPLSFCWYSLYSRYGSSKFSFAVAGGRLEAVCAPGLRKRVWSDRTLRVVSAASRDVPVSSSGSALLCAAYAASAVVKPVCGSALVGRTDGPIGASSS